MMYSRFALALTFLISVSLQAASISTFFSPSDPAGRGHLSTLACIVGGAATYTLLNNFVDQLPVINGVSQSVVMSSAAALVPGLLLADYNADGALDFSVLQGLKFWDSPSLQRSWASIKALLTMEGASNLIGGFVGAYLAQRYMTASAVAPVVAPAVPVIPQTTVVIVEASPSDNNQSDNNQDNQD